MKPEITYCKPSNRNKPKSVIKCSNPCWDVRHGNMAVIKQKVEEELIAAVDEKLISLR